MFLWMGTIKYSDITRIQEKETEIISSDSLWRGIHEYYNGLVKSNIGNGKKVILQIHSKKEFILLFMALIRTGACPIILPVSMTKNSANMLQKICSDNQDAIIMADDMGKVCVQTVTAGPNFAYQIVLNNMTENCHWDLSCFCKSLTLPLRPHE